MDGQLALCITFQACCPCAQVYNHNFLWTVYCNCLCHAQWCSYALDDNCLSHPRRCFYAQEILLKFCRNLPAKGSHTTCMTFGIAPQRGMVHPSMFYTSPKAVTNFNYLYPNILLVGFFVLCILTSVGRFSKIGYQKINYLYI